MQGLGGAFNTYVDRILPFLTPSLCVDSFYTLSVDKNRRFLTPSPPHLIHVVIEGPLEQNSGALLDKAALLATLPMALNRDRTR